MDKVDSHRNILQISTEQKGIDFVNLTEEEQKIVLHWRNHDATQKWMHQPTLITLNEHLCFIENLKQRKDKQYLMIKSQQDNLGVINFIHIDIKQGTSALGLYINPDLQRKGTGKKLMEFAITYAFITLNLQNLTLEVFSHNERAISLYKKFNFKIIAKKNIKEKKILCMRLNK